MRAIYLVLIFGVIGFMVLHNALDLLRKAARPARIEPPRAAPARERMELGFRIAHGLLAVSFGVLVYTGFALKYPEAWWAAPLLAFEDAFGLRGWLHRAAAVLMLVAAAVHVVHLGASPRARRCIRAMWPSREDGRGAVRAHPLPRGPRAGAAAGTVARLLREGGVPRRGLGPPR